MIAERNTTMQVQSTMGGEKIAMGIDQAAMSHIMGILTDLYSDPELAVIREYSTNALDANIEAGVSLPIEVTLPSALSPFFKVRDNGVGLDTEDIRSIYSQYGASTKRNTNDQVGMLGLGCKSALTYSTQFTVTSVKNGVQTVVVVSRDEEGAGGMSVVSVTPTDQGNGTEVMVPARRNHSFESKAANFYRFWQPGTVLVNGAEPKRPSGLQIADDMLVMDGVGHTNSDFVVMGNVAYPVDRYSGHLKTGLSYGHALVVTVPIGSVNFTPSREALMFTSTTKATLADITNRFRPLLEAALVKEVEKADTPVEAVRAMIRWRDLASNSGAVNWTFKGRAIPRLLPGRYFITDNSDYRLSSGAWTADTGIYTERASRMLFVRNYDMAKFTSTHKKKLLLFMQGDDAPDGVNYFALSAGEPDPLVKEWFGADRIIDWADVNALKLPRVQRSVVSGRLPGSYDYLDPNGNRKYGEPGDTIDQTKPVYFIRSTRLYAADVYQKLLGECTIVALSANRIEKFQRNLPAAKDVQEVVQEKYDAWTKSLPADDREALQMRLTYYALDSLRGLKEDRVDDPDLKRAIQLRDRDVRSLMAQREKWASVLGYLSRDDLGEWKSPLNKYPLYDVSSMRNHPDALYRYLNTEYLFLSAAKQKAAA